MEKLTPAQVESLTSQFSAGRLIDEADALALRECLAADRPGFKASDDVLADLGSLIGTRPAMRRSPDFRASAADPAPATTAPTPVVHPSGLLAQYEAVRHNPVALGEFLAANGTAVRREIMRRDNEALEAERRPARSAFTVTGSNAGLVSEYEAAKGNPKALAALLDPSTEKGKALKALLIAADTQAREEGKPSLTGEALMAAYNAVRNSPRALAEFFAEHGAAVRSLLLGTAVA